MTHLSPCSNVALEGASFVKRFQPRRRTKARPTTSPPTDKLDEQPARLVAVSQGIAAVITGELSRRGDKYSLSATALDAVSGNVRAKTEATANNKDEVLLAIPKMAAPIRKALGDTTPESVQCNLRSEPLPPPPWRLYTNTASERNCNSPGRCRRLCKHLPRQRN